MRQLQTGRRYGLQELADAAEPFMEEAGQQGRVEKRSSSGQSFDASRAPEASELLLSQEEVERRIKLAVTRQGPDFWYHYANPQPTRGGRASPSEYDCRLVACARMDGWSRGAIKSLLHCFRARRGLANPEKALRDDYVDRTIAYVEQNQPDDPFETLEDSDAQSTAEEGDKISKSDGDSRLRLEKFFKTESGDAERLVALYGRDLLYTKDEGCWYCWDPELACWVRDQAGDVVGRRYLETMRATFRAAVRLPGEAAKQLRKWARGGESASRRKNALFLARAEPPIRCKATEFENRPWLLNVKDPSGDTVTLDLKSGATRPPTREDKLLHVLNVKLDPTANCPRWEQFIQEITCDRPTLARYLQRVFAYCLTGDIGEQVFFFAYGSGANGKSTFVGVLLRLLGPYGQRSMSDTFWAEKNNSRHPVELADLHGVRVCVIQEIEPDRIWAVERIKQLTGEPETRARHLYCSPFTFRNTAKLFFNGNALPGVSDHSIAFWRRIRRIPFDAIIPKEKRVRNFDEVLWQEESSGILNWALEAVPAVRKGGVRTSPEVEEATETYRRQSDKVSQFVGECCATGEEYRARAGELFAAFSGWSLHNSFDDRESVMSQKVFAQRLNQLGFSTKRGSSGIVYLGIELLKEESR